MTTTSKAHQPIASRFAKIEGKRIHYLTAGQGPHLILLHGYTQTSRMWRPLIEKVKDKFTIIAPDLPGIGDSDTRIADVRSCAIDNLLCSPALSLASRDLAAFEQFQLPRSWLKKSRRKRVPCPRFAGQA